MNCSEVNDNLTAWVLDELEAERWAAVRDHLAGCKACRREERAFRETAEQLTDALAAEPPVELGDKHRALIERAADAHPVPPRTFRFPFWRGVAVGAAAAGLLLGAVAVLLTQTLFELRPSSDMAAGESGVYSTMRQVVDAFENYGGESPAVTSISPPPGRIPPAAEEPLEMAENLPPVHNTESYAYIADNRFLGALDNPLSTFSIDVDTASYSNVRRFLREGRLPPPDAVRIEELVNYFDFDYPNPGEELPLSASIEIAGCPWNLQNRLVRIGLKGREVAADARPDTNLVFLLDVSGSMQAANKLPLVKESLRMLVAELGERDRVAIVVYASASGQVLPSTPGSEKATILSAIDRLSAGGSTAGGAGIQLAYKVAADNFIRGGVNRVILCTDGDFNVGVTDNGQLVRLIQEKAAGGVFLTVLGYGRGNVKDDRMEQLADRGNGNYAYIDTEKEARKALVEQLSGTLVTVAKDVKLQVEFNPAQVNAYRLLGYENRLLADEDFNNDAADAGELGAGHTVTALYEVVPPGVPVPPDPLVAARRRTVELRIKAIADVLATERLTDADRAAYQRDLEKLRAEREELDEQMPAEPAVDPLRYQGEPSLTQAAQSGEMLTVKIRYKEPDAQTSKLVDFPAADGGRTYAEASGDFKFAASVAAFGMVLRDSGYKGTSSFEMVKELADEGKGDDPHGYRSEFIKLIDQAMKAPRRQ